MLAIIFEVEMNPGRDQDYFELAGSLKPELEAIDGFISVERFQSLSNEGKFVPFRSGATSRPSRPGASMRSTGSRKRGAKRRFSPTSAFAWPR